MPIKLGITEETKQHLLPLIIVGCVDAIFFASGSDSDAVAEVARDPLSLNRDFLLTTHYL